jgi:hypothetical protein
MPFVTSFTANEQALLTAAQDTCSAGEMCPALAAMQCWLPFF